MSGCCLTPSGKFFIHTMTRASNDIMKWWLWWWCLLST